MHTLSPIEFQALAASGAQIIDVRQAWEIDIAPFAGALALPLDQLPALFDRLNPQLPVGVVCHHGVRSEMAARFLEQRGFADVSHLQGGVDAWSQHIDPGIARY